MPTISSGLLIYKLTDNAVRVLLVHPGGPFWEKKDLGAWSIPKGEVEPGEDPLAAAYRELEEETGFAVTGEASPLGQIRQSGRKTVRAWSILSDVDLSAFRSNAFKLEWPRGSNTFRSFPEVDKVAWFDIGEAHRRIHPKQREFLDALESKLRLAMAKDDNHSHADDVD